MRPRHRLLAGTAVGALLAAVYLGAAGDAPAPKAPTLGAAADDMGASASCVGPYLDDQPPGGPYGTTAPTMSPGDTLVVYGHWFTSTCNDTGGHDRVVPLEPVRLTLTLPGGRAVPLGVFTPRGPDMGFSADVAIPLGTSAGTATIRGDRHLQVPYRFDVRADS